LFATKGFWLDAYINSEVAEDDLPLMAIEGSPKAGGCRCLPLKQSLSEINSAVPKGPIAAGLRGPASAIGLWCCVRVKSCDTMAAIGQ
jgi:hypothetical protein